MFNGINMVMSECESLRSKASSVQSGWKDGVQERFYNGRMEEIYGNARHFFNAAHSQATALSGDETKIRELMNRATTMY